MKKSLLYTSMILNVALSSGSVYAAKGQDRMGVESGVHPSIVRTLHLQALHGDAEAQLELGKLYEAQENQESREAAYRWYKRAAENGSPEAMFYLGLMHINEMTEAAVESSGLYWLEMAAKKGHHQASVVYDSLMQQDFTIGC